MPSPCDLVADALHISDAVRLGIAQNVPSDNLLNISDDFAIGAFTRIADSLTIGDALIQMWTQQLRDTLHISDAVAQHLVAKQLLRDTLRISDRAAFAISDEIGDAVSISDATTVGVAQIVADVLNIGDGVATHLAAVQLLRDRLTIGDAIQSGFASRIADSLTIGDAVEQRQALVSLVVDHLTISDAAHVGVAAVQTVRDTLAIADAVAQLLSTSTLVADTLAIADYVSGGAPGAWTAHVEPFAMSRYTGFGFNSMAEVGGYLLLAGEGGIFVATGATDAGSQIAAQVEHDLSDAVLDKRGEMRSDDHLKRPRYLYTSYRTAGQIAVELGYVDLNDAGNAYVERRVTETADAVDTAQLLTGRVPLSRGVRSRYLRPILKNVSGAAFAMNDASLMVDSIKRKV
jgi:UDP-3-O-[3-hydroxymyristoyl] glucosamine N-acyltransferase